MLLWPDFTQWKQKRPVRIYLPQKKVNKYIRNPYFVNLKAQLLKSCYENCRKLSPSGQGSSIYKSNSVSSHSHSFSGLKVRIRIQSYINYISYSVNMRFKSSDCKMCGQNLCSLCRIGVAESVSMRNMFPFCLQRLLLLNVWI